MIKKYIKVLCLLLILQLQLEGQSYIIGTYNIRYDNPKDTGNEWHNRRPVIESLIRFYEFDILGTQEGLYHQLHELDSLLTGYTYVGVGRSDGIKAGEHSSIFFKTEKFKIIQKGDFWLSPTPEKPGAGWDAKIPRICSWVKLKDKKSGKELYVFNAHFDHQGVQARNESSKLILTRIKAIVKNTPVIFMGDLNTNQKEQSYLTIAGSGIVRDAFEMVKTPYLLNGTFNGFDINRKSTDRIDHIFLSTHFAVNRYGVLTDSYGGKYPSDHFPVLANIILK